MLAPDVTTTEHQLRANRAAAQTVTNYAQATVTAVPSVESPPSWFQPMQQNLETAQRHAKTWLGQLCPRMTASVPQALIDYSGTFGQQSGNILGVLNDLQKQSPAVPSAAQRQQVDGSFTMLQAALAKQAETIGQLRGHVQQYFTDVVADHQRLSDDQSQAAQRYEHGKYWVQQMQASLSENFLDSQDLGPCESIVEIEFDIQEQIGALGAAPSLITLAFALAILKNQKNNETASMPALQAVLDSWTTLQVKLQAVQQDLSNASDAEFAGILQRLDLLTAQRQWQQLATFARQLQVGAGGADLSFPTTLQSQGPHTMIHLLDFARKGTYEDQTGYAWVFYGDLDQENLFYILPRPSWRLDDAGKPELKLVTYQTDGPGNGAGFAQISVELTIPTEILTAVKAAIPKQFPDAGSDVVIQALAYNPGAEAVLTLADATGTRDIVAPASEFGANTSTFTVQLTAGQMKTLQAQLGTKGGSLPIQYRMTVPASLPAVTATLTFNSALAYRYQVSHAHHYAYGHSTPRSVSKLIQESGSSHVDLEWGVENPSQQLRDDVTNWANDTLQALITARVNAALKALGENNYDSFTISEVNSFKAVYSQNEVIDWWIFPQASLPSMADLDLDLDAFSATVDERQQTMTVYVHMPFAKDSRLNPNLPIYEDKPVLLDRVTVTVTYPGLSQASATHTFSANGSYVFTAPYDPSHGSSFDVSYEASFQNSPGLIHGQVSDIESGATTLTLPAVGLLTVTFDAHQVFAASQDTQYAVGEVDIDFSWVAPTGLTRPVQQKVTITKGAKVHRASLTSLTGQPIDSTYNFDVTYRLASQAGTSYTAPTYHNKTGFLQRIPPLQGVNTTNLILAYPSTSGPPILGADVKIYYADAASVPGVRQPTQDSPATFSLEPKSVTSGWTYAQKQFDAFLNNKNNAPFIYSGAINSLGGQTVLNDQKIENDQASILFSPTQRYYTVEIDMQAVDWKSATFDSVQVEIVPRVDGQITAQNTRTAQWNRQQSSPFFITFPYNQGQTPTYDWKVIYITPGKRVQHVFKAGSKNPILDVPASPEKAPSGATVTTTRIETPLSELEASAA